MESRTTERFRKAYRGLLAEIQQQARDAYRLWKHDPSHPSLHFKKVHNTLLIYSVRITLGYRALGVKKNDAMLCFGLALMPNMTGCCRNFE